MAKLTPMMEQYVKTKEEYSDCILFYRLGDFYEMFFEDAKVCSKELELTLTGKSCGLDERAPMCGVPFHSADGYIDKLVKKGYKVAICEQVEDPKEAKGLVKREVIRIVTPGTNTSSGTLDESRNNYIMSLFCCQPYFGISIADITTGSYYVTEVNSAASVLDEINRFMPKEIICNDALFVSEIDTNDLENRLGIVLSLLPGRFFSDTNCEEVLCKHFNLADVSGLGLEKGSYSTIAAGTLLQYMLDTQKTALSHINRLTPYVSSDYMFLDSATRRNLELTETIREKNKRGSLLWVLDKTCTAMGARCLRTNVEQPLIDSRLINKRLDAVNELVENMVSREELREYLSPVYDLERLITKVSYKSVNPRDMIALRNSLRMLPHIKFVTGTLNSALIKQLHKELDTLEDICSEINDAICDEPPLALHEGNIIRDGYNEVVDKLRVAKIEGKSWLAQMEERERNSTGIKNLKIKYNRVFGYYLEVTNSYKDLVPACWIRKQTLAGAERYTTEELKKLEDTILGAEDRLYTLEYELYVELRDKIYQQMERIQKSAGIIANIDMFASLALVAEQNNYVRPIINTKGVINIKDGRHPVIEKMLTNYMFVSNDTMLDCKNNRISIITGPNMAGKSTYMRQTALITLMAQIGSFVPASSAEIGICDRIFTRVGASDDLASGQSTFMVEMTEVANILRNATKNSLIILDEIGRGTSTFDGLAIAWAVVEHISNTKCIGAKTLFATHYHELTELEGKLSGVNNYCIAVKEQGEDIVFLRKIVKGGADKSYGIQVAKLAGVPDAVIARANELVMQLTANDLSLKTKSVLDKPKQQKIESDTEMSGSVNQISIFDIINKTEGFDDIILEIHDMDLNALSPIDALNLLYGYQKRMKEKF
ncbi:MAG: DNA mismatch repair protein MutS [Lachnospiraceae bacterium]|nr:DNA mismatch repair protein MutS [Lachnospiraceae bacterium]